jgi:hypothetical protein
LEEDGQVLSEDYGLEEGDTIKLIHEIKSLSQPMTVKTLTGKFIEFSVEPFYTIADVKLLIHCLEHLPSCQQRFIFAGKHLEDERTVKDCNITADALVLLFLRLGGS